MAKFLVSYDLRKRRDHGSLHEALRGLGAVRILESDWLLSSLRSAAQVRDLLAAHLDGDDGLLVAALTGEAAWQRLLVSDGGAKDRLMA